MIKIKIVSCLFLLIFLLAGRFNDGTDDIGTITDSPSISPLTGGFTIMFWIKLASDAAENKGHAIYYQFVNANDNVFLTLYPYLTYGGAWEDKMYANWQMKDGTGTENSGNFELVFGTDDTRGEWHHWAFVRPENGGDKYYAYFDGVKILSTLDGRITDNSVDNNANATIGTADNSWYVHGILDDYVVITREVSEADVYSHMVGRWIPDKVTSIDLPMTEGSGDSFDITVYDNDCSWSGTVVAEGAPILQIK